MDSQVTDAIYKGGVLEPLSKLSLDESERVRLIVERHGSHAQNRQPALERLGKGIAQMSFSMSGPLLGRDELHDRV